MRADWPVAEAFAGPPDAATLERWKADDRAARPDRLDRLRRRMAAEDVDAYFGVRREHMRYLTGFTLADGEEQVAGHSGRFLVSADDVVVLADTRYDVQARREAPDARVEPTTYDLAARWPDLVASIGARRIAVESGFVSHALWERLEAALPGVSLVPVEGWLEADRAIKTPSEVERIAAAAAVADRALARLLPELHPGVTEHDLALRLEFLMRTSGAESLAFDIACLAGPEAALPHGSPGDRPIRDGQVLLFDFGAQVAGYRSDMTRTLFVGEPSARDLGVYELVSASQAAAIAFLEAGLGRSAEAGQDRGGDGSAAAGDQDGGVEPLPSGRAVDAMARAVIDEDGRWPAYGHGLGHGIGLATHEAPSLSRSAPDVPLPSPTVFSVEPGIYLEGAMGVRIEDLVAFDAEAGRLTFLTHFPRDVIVVGD